MNQETVSAESGEVVVDGRRGGVEDPGDLAVGGAGDGVLVDLQQEFGTFEPVGGAEGLVAEGASAGSAAVTLDDMGRFAAAEEAEADVGPGPGLRAVVLAVRVGAVGRGRGAWKWCVGVHAAGPGKARTRQQSSRYVSLTGRPRAATIRPTKGRTLHAHRHPRRQRPRRPRDAQLARMRSLGRVAAEAAHVAALGRGAVAVPGHGP